MNARPAAPALALVTCLGCDGCVDEPPPAPLVYPLDTVEVIAGETSGGVADGVGDAARFNGPAAIGVDGARALVSDTFSASMRVVDLASDTVTTILRAPDLIEPRGITGRDGTIYVGDATCIRVVPPDSAAASVLAGDCQRAGYVDGDAATARFEFLLHDLELDAARGALYVSDRLNDAIRAVDLQSGTVATLAGGDGAGSDDGVGAAARFEGPGGLALDEQLGVLYVADTFNSTLRAVDLASATVSTVAGVAGTSGSVDGPVASARLDMPQGVALVERTLLFGGFDGRARALDLDAGAISTVVQGLGGTFASPEAIPGQRAVLWMDLGNALLRIDVDAPANERVTHVAGPRAPYGFIDGPGRDARFARPTSVAVDADGRTAYVSDIDNHAIRVVDVVDRTVRTLVGAPDREGDRDGALDEARLSSPTGLALDAAARVLYLAEAGNQKIRAIDLEQGTVVTLSGSGERGGRDGDAAEASFAEPWEVALDDDALYVADSGGSVVRRVERASGAVSTLAGSYGDADHVDGSGADARFRVPVGLALVGGTLFVADYEAHTLRRVDVRDGATTTMLGSDGLAGAVGGPAAFAALSQPSGLVASDDGARLYLAEEGGNVLREIELADESSRLLVGNGVSAGGLPTGVPVPISDATLLAPQDVALAGADLVVLSDTAVWLVTSAARPAGDGSPP